MKLYGKAAVAVAVVACMLLGCREEKLGIVSTEQPPQEPGKKVLAVVGDDKITQADVEAMLGTMPERARKRNFGQALRNMVDVKVFSAEARKAGLEKDPEVQQAFERAEKEILARTFLVRNVEPLSKPSQEDFKAFYEQYKDDFVIPEGVFVLDVLTRSQKQAELALKMVREGRSMEQLSAKATKPAWNRGGRWWLFRGRMAPELEKVVFSLEQGKPSDIIKTDKGYHIIQVVKKKDKAMVTLEQAMPKLRLRLQQQKKRELIHQYYEKAHVNLKPDEQGVLVKVEDKAFTDKDLDHILAKAKEPVPDQEKDKIMRRWVQYFVDTEVFSAEARKAGLEKDPEVVQEIERRRNTILSNTFRRRFVWDKCEVTDKEVSDDYHAHLASFKKPLRLRLRMILVKTMKEAQDILTEIKKGTEFTQLARERSIGPSAERGGEMGWFAQGEKDPAVEKAAMSLKLYEVSDVIHTDKGFGIVKLMGRHGGDVQSLKDVAPRIKMALRGRKMDRETKTYYDKAGVKFFGAFKPRSHPHDLGPGHKSPLEKKPEDKK